MTKDEFISKITTDKIPTDEEYDVIETVYAFHPCIDNVKGKEQIAELYSKFGFRVIKDMKETAEKARQLEDKILKLNSQLDAVRQEYNLLKSGKIS